MPKYAIINDQHFGVNGDSEFFHENYRQFYDNVFIPSIRVEKPVAVLIPGDLWQSRKQINPLTLAVARECFFDPLAALGVQVYISYGNHDVYYKNTNDVNSIDFIGQMYPNVHVVPTFLELDGGVSLMSWWCADNEKVMREHLETTESKIIVGHFEIEGHLMTPGHVCDHGLPRSMFDKFAAVVSGHFHVRGTDGIVTYTSNPSQTTWSDYGLEKGFHYLETDTVTLTPVNNPYEIYEVVRYDDAKDLTDFSAYSSKIVKVQIGSYVTIDLVAFKAFLASLDVVAHKVTVVETDKFDGTSTLVVQGDVQVLPVLDVIVDFAREQTGEDIREGVAAEVTDLYHAVTL